MSPKVDARIVIAVTITVISLVQVFVKHSKLLEYEYSYTCSIFVVNFFLNNLNFSLKHCNYTTLKIFKSFSILLLGQDINLQLIILLLCQNID